MYTMLKASNFKNKKNQNKLILVVTLFLLIVVATISCFMGIANVSLLRLLATFLPALPISDGIAPLNHTELMILTQLRLPRIAMAILAGIGLSVSGLLMQVITGNKMASPFTTGLSSAAAFGASLAILYRLMPFGNLQLGTIIMAFSFSFLCALLVYGISSAKGMGKTTIILVGIALNYFFSALNAGMQYVADERQLVAIVHWTFGSFTEIIWSEIIFVAIILALILPIVWKLAWQYNLLSTGDESATALGVNVMRLRLLSGFFTTLIAASIISFTGVIGFVGLVAPHIARLLVGGNFRILMPTSLLVGALLLVSADTLGRTIVSPVIVPVGIIVSFIGVPVFIYLIVREQKERLL